MADLEVAVDGYAHAVFLQEFFSGPVTDYSVTSSDTAVAAVGVRAPDMLLVAPVSNGSASITVTATGPGGTATQTFLARVGAGPEQVDRPTSSPAPATVPPAPTPEPEPEPEPELPDGSDELLPIEDDLPPRPPDTAETLPADSLEPLEATEAPTLADQVPAQTVAVGATITVDVRPHFGGIIDGWTVEISDTAVAAIEPSPGAGRAVLRGVATGTATVTVTAANNLGEVAQAFNVTVTEQPPTTTTTQGSEASTGILVLEGENPSVRVDLGQSTTLEMSRHFSSAATSFSVRSVPAGVNVTVSGSVATITGVARGDYTITLVASNTNASIERPARIRVD